MAALLERRANPDLANNQQTTPLHYAVRADELHDQLDRCVLFSIIFDIDVVTDTDFCFFLFTYLYIDVVAVFPFF